ncbi:hypothetical protein B5E41_13390 [Rhizobium esperanzae]|uniref:Uncharacterized protein n=1 Tax=Rhizobium esperanzae TaxID=1967781 RepID=A0A246DWP5_9HYPH|nr:hypothetical protein [Rhizobium esperanzae]OWO94729.1 hypothetical protein B5E41_13390 [Rhizobium esperanzae]
MPDLAMSMIERVAKAICAREYQDPNALINSYPDGPLYPVWKDFERCARAAIEEMREPNKAMDDAGEEAIYDLPRHIAVMAYEAMLDAALKENEGQKA